MSGETPASVQQRSKKSKSTKSHYGKLSPSIFTGSMFGAGTDVFALWAYVIANAYKETIELNPSFLAHVLGCTPERVETAISYLCEPDPQSENEESRYLIREGQFQYRVIISV
jgi:hypothetical protein